MITYFEDGGETTVTECEIRLNPDGEISIFYDIEGEEHTYKGVERGQGHWILRKSDHTGEASLHAFEGSVFYDGWWKEGQYKGMWRIRVDSD
jgi:hypothetical protein